MIQSASGNKAGSATIKKIHTNDAGYQDSTSFIDDVPLLSLERDGAKSIDAFKPESGGDFRAA